MLDNDIPEEINYYEAYRNNKKPPPIDNNIIEELPVAQSKEFKAKLRNDSPELSKVIDETEGEVGNEQSVPNSKDFKNINKLLKGRKANVDLNPKNVIYIKTPQRTSNKADNLTEFQKYEKILPIKSAKNDQEKSAIPQASNIILSDEAESKGIGSDSISPVFIENEKPDSFFKNTSQTGIEIPLVENKNLTEVDANKLKSISEESKPVAVSKDSQGPRQVVIAKTHKKHKSTIPRTKDNLKFNEAKILKGDEAEFSKLSNKQEATAKILK